ncbi:hypothetical protein Ddye_014814 [Dipteronia dyeriana]|uniref:Uncharacterized protein n=1 Tax=Dipteronia dyeriana TaxID=168575 RepID=A0AAD9WZ02_9ROSI|nr:hypothetical protein Ddye_014814 [Dipteronia dyeriana]
MKNYTLSNLTSMASNLLILSSLLLFSALTASESKQYFSKKISPSSLGLKKEKLTHLHFNFHDIITTKIPLLFKWRKPPRPTPPRPFLVQYIYWTTP